MKVVVEPSLEAKLTKSSSIFLPLENVMLAVLSDVRANMLVMFAIVASSVTLKVIVSETVRLFRSAPTN